MKRFRFAGRGCLAIEASSLGVEFTVVARTGEAFARVGDVAVVDIRGPLMQHDDWCCDNYDAIRARVSLALQSPCATVVLRIDSPGGEVAGCFELSSALRAMASKAGKRLIAYADGMIASAAYALACAASEIYVPATAIVGSIGCIKQVADMTAQAQMAGVVISTVTSGARKADANPHVPMSEASLAALQREVDEMAGVFFALVAESRGTTTEKVGALQAATFLGASAVAAGLADRVLTFDGLLAMLASGDTEARPTGAEATMTKREQAIAALKAMAEGDDEKDKEYAKAALAAMSDEKDEGEKKDEAKAADDDAPPPAKKKDDEKKDDDGAKALATVQSLAARIAAREEADERARLMATRPDFTPEVAAFLSKQPLATVRDAVAALPKSTPAKGQVAAARAALTVQPTLGETQAEGGDRLPDDEAADLDIQMGLAKRAKAIRNEGTRQYLGVMTPAEARAEVARREALAQKGATR